jgi:palmitoyl transferase
MRTKLLSAVVLLGCCFGLRAEASWWADSYNFLKNDIKEVWYEHDYELFVPFYAWHNRLTYDREHLDRYNEYPWGAGFGISHSNEEGTWSGLYALGFKDSNSYFETYFGYARQWNWFAGEQDQWHAGVGYTLGLTQRHEYHYIPVPLPLPLVGAGYRNFEVHGAYIPGVKNDGNVFFMFARLRI